MQDHASTVARNPAGASQLVARLNTQDTAEPAVRALLSRYGCRALGRPRERIVKWTAKIEEALRDQTNAAQALDALMAGDTRRMVFLLEGLLKLYRKTYPKLESQYQRVKALEDALGGISYTAAMLREVDTTGLPDKVIQQTREKCLNAQAKAEQLLADRWLPGTAPDGRIKGVASILAHLDAQAWQPYDQDRETLLKTIRSELHEIETNRYDMADLHNGLHELRRRLRWISVFTEAVDGLVVLDATRNPLPALAPRLDTDLARSKFAQLQPPVRESTPVRLSKSLYLENMAAVLELGAIKDALEPLDFVATALQEAGLTTNRAASEALALTSLDHPQSYINDKIAAAENLYIQLRDTDLLRTFRHELKPRP